MASYYNACHVSKQFKIGDFVKLSTKNLKFKCYKLSFCWIDLFQVFKWIDEQAYQLALPDKYAWLHPVFLIQLLENYCCCDDDAELMAMPDLKESQENWDVKEVWDKQQIKDVIHYLVKWAGWPSEYNFYELASHLVDALKAVASFKCKLKCKQKEAKTAASCKHVWCA